MENSTSVKDTDSLSTSAFLAGNSIITGAYINMQSDDMEDRNYAPDESATNQDEYSSGDNSKSHKRKRPSSANDPENTDDSNNGNFDPLHAVNMSSGPLREQDRFLPIANVAKIMKRAIPEAGKIAKDARECVQECVSEFISFITSEASDRCHMEKRKTINGEDILFAMTTLGFDNYVEPLKMYLQKYRETTKGDNSSTNSAISGNNEDSKNEHPTIFEDQIFTISTASDTTSSETPIIYSYSAVDQMQFHIN